MPVTVRTLTWHALQWNIEHRVQEKCQSSRVRPKSGPRHKCPMTQGWNMHVVHLSLHSLRCHKILHACPLSNAWFNKLSVFRALSHSQRSKGIKLKYKCVVIEKNRSPATMNCFHSPSLSLFSRPDPASTVSFIIFSYFFLHSLRFLLLLRCCR